MRMYIKIPAKTIVKDGNKFHLQYEYLWLCDDKPLLLHIRTKNNMKTSRGVGKTKGMCTKCKQNNKFHFENTFKKSMLQLFYVHTTLYISCFKNSSNPHKSVFLKFQADPVSLSETIFQIPQTIQSQRVSSIFQKSPIFPLDSLFSVSKREACISNQIQFFFGSVTYNIKQFKSYNNS